MEENSNLAQGTIERLDLFNLAQFRVIDLNTIFHKALTKQVFIIVV